MRPMCSPWIRPRHARACVPLAKSLKHLSHDEQDELNGAIEGLPAALNKKLTVALGSGEFENLQEVVEHLADGLSAKQMQFLRRAIDELPARVRDKIDIAGRKDQPDL